MTLPPRPKTQPITHHVPEQLVEAFLQAADEFFSAARGPIDKEEGETRPSWL